MFRSVAAAFLALALSVAVAGHAQGRVVKVDGDHFRDAGLTPVGIGCFDPNLEPTQRANFKVRRGPGNVPLGKYSSGWVNDEFGFGFGAAGVVDSPTTLRTFRIQVVSPGGETQGSAVATYFPPDDDGYWIGVSALGEDSRSGWHTTGAVNQFFLWRHFTASGSYDADGPSNTIAGHALANGGDGEGARLGFVFGCNAEPFFVDRLQLATDEDNKTYDFGGFKTRAGLQVDGKTRESTTVTAGNGIDLRGSLVEKHDGSRIAGVVRFQSKALKNGKWKTFRKDRTSPSDAAKVQVKPLRNTAYRVVYAGTASRYEPDVSGVTKVFVKMRATASFVDPAVTRGTNYAVVGKVAPGKRTGVQLQRKVNGEWRTVRKGTTSSSGGYRLGGTAQDTGTSYWRVRVDGGATNADGVSRTIKLTVSAPPTGGGGGDDGGGGGGGGGGGENPPPPPEG